MFSKNKNINSNKKKLAKSEDLDSNYSKKSIQNNIPYGIDRSKTYLNNQKCSVNMSYSSSDSPTFALP